MTLELDITQDLIEAVGRACPIEAAIAEKTPYGAHVRCSSITLWSKDAPPIQIPITYKRALDFIARWDAGKTVKPFKFQIEVSS